LAADLALWDLARPGGQAVLRWRFFDGGDVLSVPSASMDPVTGHQQRGTRPAPVLYTKEFNKLGAVLVAPIIQGANFSRYAGFAVSSTGTGCSTQAVALVNRIRLLDLVARKAHKVERAPQAVIDDALGRLTALLG